MKNEIKQAWQSLQSFYRLRNNLLPEFAEKNKVLLGNMEDKLVKDYQNLCEMWALMQ